MPLSALLGLSSAHSPLLRNALPATALSLAIQAAVGLPSTLIASPPTERYFDLSGAVSFVAVAALSLWLPRLRAELAAGADTSSSSAQLPPPHWRQLALSGAVVLWATRLGTYLFRRILRERKDSRFDPMRKFPARLLVAWTIQAFWVVICQAPVTAVNAIGPAPALPGRLLWSDVLGFGLYAAGLLVECVADWQKAVWVAGKHAKQHDELFMTRGLWSKCRYPNYFGEITLWTGLAVAAAGVLVREPVRAALGGIGVAKALAMSGASPAFVAFLLLKMSGVPLSERKYDRLYGGRADYQAWRQATPTLVPKLF